MTAALHEEIRSLPEFFEAHTWRLEDALRKIVPTRIQHSIRSLVLTGTGESLIAAQAAVPAFQRFARIPANAVSSFEAAHSLLPTFEHAHPHDPFVIASSHSGSAANTLRASAVAHDVGGYVVALTATTETELSQLADVTVELGAEEHAGPLARYLLPALTMTLIAIRFGEVRGKITMDEAQDLRNELAALGQHLLVLVEEQSQQIETLSHNWNALESVEFLGADAGKAGAAYGSLVTIMDSGKRATHVDLDEFMHAQSLEMDPASIGTVIVANDFGLSQRTDEVIERLRSIGRPWMTIGHAGDAKTNVSLPDVRREFTSLAASVPLRLLAHSLATNNSIGRIEFDSALQAAVRV